MHSITHRRSRRVVARHRTARHRRAGAAQTRVRWCRAGHVPLGARDGGASSGRPARRGSRSTTVRVLRVAGDGSMSTLPGTESGGPTYRVIVEDESRPRVARWRHRARGVRRWPTADAARVSAFPVQAVTAIVTDERGSLCGSDRRSAWCTSSASEFDRAAADGGRVAAIHRLQPIGRHRRHAAGGRIQSRSGQDARRPPVVHHDARA